MNQPNWKILNGDALEMLKTLPSESVQTCITSPPYFGLRDYGTAQWVGGSESCDHQGEPMRTRAYVNQNCGTGNDVKNAANNQFFRNVCGKCGASRADKQIGLEETPADFVNKLVEVFAEVWRVLRPDGTLWLNLGDSYVASATGSQGNGKSRLEGGKDTQIEAGKRPSKVGFGLAPKNLIGIPWRVAFALQDFGYYLRQEIIWHKPNPMPESVTDRCTKSHEHIFLLTKSERYYFDNAAIRERNSSKEQLIHNLKYAKAYGAYDLRAPLTGQPNNVNNVGIHSRPGTEGRNKRSVWTVSTKPFPEAHFATFPEDLIKPMILAGSREGDTVLDCFNGAATTGVVANKHGRNYVGIELNPEYIKISERRLNKLRLPLFEI